MGTAVRAMVVLVAVICVGEARECYNCTGDCVRSSDCKGSCFSSVPELGGDEIRGCINETKESQCVPDNKDEVLLKTCYCNTELCNPASTPVHLDIFLFLLLISAPILLRVR
ncbi:hypothetical protein GWK47_048409 [Chionoecetes opilio]|uniref:Activin types I and II receptor domain-containing protein n=1 Tax=Chionoecetes opilio TaxID=41210 RepID=A0A8J4YC03_CHIOP|nr:hypothetical protein GWK47_048409 [Chionoecetes opilio]